jgi:tetratricopeptide (TPR) repeat protein
LQPLWQCIQRNIFTHTHVHTVYEMSIRRTAARNLLVAFLGIGAVASIWAVVVSRSSTSQLHYVRGEVDQLFKSHDSVHRTAHANNCIRVARNLIGDEDPFDAAASLYMIAVAPIASSDIGNVDIPEESRVETITTIDLLKIARLFFQSRRFGPADQLIDLILSRNDDWREDGLRLAVTIRFDIGRDDDVIRHCHEILKLSPDDPQIHRVLSLVHRNHGRMELFIESTEKVLQLGNPNDHESRVNLVDGYVRLGRTADARREFDKVTQYRPDLVLRAPTLHARLLTQEGKQDEAMEVLDQLLAKVPDDPEGLVLKGTVLVSAQKYEQAIQALRAAIEASPAEEQAYYQLGQAYARSGQPALAQQSLAQHKKVLDAKVSIHEMEQLASRDPENVTVRVELAHAYADIGLMDLADFWTRAALAAEGR